MRVSYAAAATGQGRAGPPNANFHCAEPALGLFAVADGTRIDAGGWVASRIVIRALRQFVAETQHDPDAAWPCPMDTSLSPEGNRLKAGLVMAGRSVSGSADPDGRPVSAMICALLLGEESAVIANLGGCEVYLGREGSLGKLPAPRAPAGVPTRLHPGEDAGADISGTLGGGEEPQRAEVVEVPFLPGDVCLLCTDGLVGAADESAIAAVLFDDRLEIKTRVRRLVDLASGAGGITALVLQAEQRGSAE